MDKNKFLFLLLFLFPLALKAQNLQVHYDFGKDRNFITTTFEMFKPDKLGSTFTFINFDYNLGKEKHPALAYWEIARSFNLGKTPFSAQIEYNGGVLAKKKNEIYYAYPINNAYLAGINYGWHSSDFTKSFNFRVLYKHISGKNPNSFQLTSTWNVHLLNNKLSLMGFADFWREDNTNFTNAAGEAITPTKTKFVFMSEPQIWYNITPNLSVGSEVEIGVNFSTVQGLKICPTIATKWIF